MIYQSMEFHNIVEISPRDNFPGVQLRRIPASVSAHCSERGRWNAQMTPGAEIRCVTDSENLRLFVSALEGDAPLQVYQGDFYHSQHMITPGKIHCIHVSPNPKVKQLPLNAAWAKHRFSPNVWRFLLPSVFSFFHELEVFDHPVRPPMENEKPSTRWLAYGSSITAGTGSTASHLSYIQQTAHRLGIDVLNLGQGGACMCEKEIADFHATRGDWDFVTLEIGVNMIKPFTTDEFKVRADYLIRRMQQENAGKPIVLITPYLNFHHYVLEEEALTKRLLEYTDVLNSYAGKADLPDIHIINGREILTDFCGLTADLIHPFDTGMMQMGENLAAALRKIPAVAKLLPKI